MYHHAPEGYECPFCRIIREADYSNPMCDMILQTETVTAFLGLGRWEKTPLDVLIVPNAHVENLFDLPLELVPDLHLATKAVAIALKEVYRCDGISTRQHNELAGDQDVWHYHVHITPRFDGDNFYKSEKVIFPENERLDEARKLREYLSKHSKLLIR